MISARNLIKMARKWQKVAALRRKRISLPEKTEAATEAAEKGRFVVYTTDGVRFSFPIDYLGSLIFRELLRMSEEEFGLPRDGPITVPCDSQLLRYVASLMEKKAARDVEKALLLSMAAYRCSSSQNLHQRRRRCQRILVSGC